MEDNKYIPLSSQTHTIRIGQVISTYGPGAIVDFVDQSLMTAGCKHWGGKSTKTIHDERLEKVLNVHSFKTPVGGEYGKGIPFVRFPEWYFCPICRRFQPLSKWEYEFNKRKSDKEAMKKPVCKMCRNIKLIPASILVVCEEGHIHDFPWVEWVHYKKPICSNPKLKLSINSGTLGTEGFYVECTNCGCKESLVGSFSQGAFEKRQKKDPDKDFRCKGSLPWNGTKETCGIFPTSVQRNGLNVYYSKVESSIVIPPYTDELNTAVEESEEYEALLRAKSKKERKGKLDEFFEDDLEDYIEDIAGEIKCSDKKTIKEIVLRKIKPSDEVIETRNTYREEEYDALTRSDGRYNSKDFKVESQDINKYNMKELSKVVLVKKLREIRALVGFSRLVPPDQHIIGDGNVISLKNKRDNWYPAYDVRGEGIFIEFNQDLIEKWSSNSKIHQRTKNLNLIYNKDKEETGLMERNITPKFILLHTIAHLLIRELSFECGYSAASLRERIYCNDFDSDKNMSGILIYTADSDSEGSLGGLVQQGKADFLPNSIKRAVNRAKWCSADPVCVTSEGQGRGSLNLAACHSCVLLPETSCEEFNVLLDRVAVVGELEDEATGFLSKYI